MARAVLTRSYDNARTGANTEETELTPQVVGARGLRKLFSLAMSGDKRGAEAQPLVVPSVRLPDGKTHDVVYLCSMANTVWAFDANDGTMLWKDPVSLGIPIDGSADIDTWQVNDHWGILSTPVIDRESGSLYVVSWSSPDRSVANAVHSLHALDIGDGRARELELSLEGATFDAGHGLPTQRFRSAARKQRPALLLTATRSPNGATRKTLFIAFGSLKEDTQESRGWVIACNLSPLQISASWCSTARDHGAGIWQAGQGLAADEQGFVYAMTGNGTFDGVTDFAESVVKLQYSPPDLGKAAKLEIVDWFTPFTDAARTGRDPAIISEPKAPNVANATTVRATAQAMGGDWGDQDLGSAAPVLVAGERVVGCGKDGVLYVLDRHHFGKTSLADLSNPAENYKKLKSAPIFFT
jgi:hypothetical protein